MFLPVPIYEIATAVAQALSSVVTDVLSLLVTSHHLRDRICQVWEFLCLPGFRGLQQRRPGDGSNPQVWFAGFVRILKTLEKP